MDTSRLCASISPLALRYSKWFFSMGSQLASSSTSTIVGDWRSGAEPFLSIVMRTQGNRPSELSDALLCLDKQSSLDFELILAVHNEDSTAIDSVLETVCSKSDSLFKRTMVIHVVGGNRSTPLNFGFSHATGKYLAFYDDDDLVFPDWVACFRNRSMLSDREVIYSFVYVQNWAKESSSGTPGPVAEYDLRYCHTFSVFDLLVGNRCPAVGCAFPREVFFECGVRFDEQMDVLEDWDFLLQSVLRFGITFVERATSVYRLWETGSSSHSLYDETVWTNCRARVARKIEGIPLLFKEGSLSGFLTQEKRVEYLVKSQAKLYYDLGNGYSENSIVTPSRVEGIGDCLSVSFDALGKCGLVGGLRFDPCDGGFIVLKNVKFEIVGENFVEQRTIDSFAYDGERLSDNSLVFLHSDPKIVVGFNGFVRLRSVRITFSVRSGVEDGYIDEAFSAWKSRIS